MDEGSSGKLMAKVMFKASAEPWVHSPDLVSGAGVSQAQLLFSLSIIFKKDLSRGLCVALPLPGWEWSFPKGTWFPGSYLLGIQNVLGRPMC